MHTQPEDNDIELEPENELMGEESDLLDEEESADTTIRKWRNKYKEAEAKAAAALEETQRAKADFLNIRRRIEEEQRSSKERLATDFVESLLPLCDSFSMAMSNTEQWESVDAKWRKGVEGIYSQLQQILTEYNVTAISPLGEHFDPYVHEALSTEESDKESDTIIRVVQLGYERNGDIIRPAKVIISN